VLRRKALVDVGGFATGTLASDLHTSIRLHKRGWTSVYYGRPLAFGRASTRLVPFLERCHRRVRGGMQVWRRERIAFARGLSLRQRAAYLSTVLAYLEGWQRLVLYIAPALVLATGALPIAQLDRDFVLRFVPYYLLACWVFDETTRGYGRVVLSERFRMIRFPTFVTAAAAFILPSASGATRSRGGCDVAATKRALWPQYAVCAVNLVAIPLGMYQHVRGAGLPTGELLATALWAVVTAAIAALAAHKTLRATIDRRREYRFPLPVPLRTRTPSGHETVALATDLSPLGCRIVGEPLGYARRGDELQGELLLPTGPLAVVASVRAITEPRSKDPAQPALACEFRWGLSEERNQLETFLYGSDLQWQLNGLTDRAPTLLERIAAWLGASARVETRRLAGQTWSPVLYKRVNSEQGNGVGFISRSDPKTGVRTIVSLGVLPRSGRLYAEEVTAAGPRGVVGRVEDEQVLETHAAPIYLYRLTA
jgi:cellulose synthase (UDP-forming)